MIILHIPVCFDKIERITDKRRDFEISCLEQNLQSLTESPAKIYVSINGHAKSKYLDKTIELCKLHGNCEHFRRENTGYQWGGYFDVWKKTKSEAAEYWGTLEVDNIVCSNWWHKLGNFQHVGKPPIRNDIGRLRWPERWKLNDRAERHTSGGYHFCKHGLLTKIEKQFNCFTNSAGNNHLIDGILLGEVGFCTKVITVGEKLHEVNILSKVVPYK